MSKSSLHPKSIIILTLTSVFILKGSDGQCQYIQDQFFDPFFQEIPKDHLRFDDFKNVFISSDYLQNQVQIGIDQLNGDQFFRAIRTLKSCKNKSGSGQITKREEANLEHLIGKGYLLHNLPDSGLTYLYASIDIVKKSIAEIGLHWIQEGLNSDSVRKYITLAEIHYSQDPLINLFLGKAYKYLRSYKKAKRYAQIAIENDPNFYAAYDLLSSLHEELGDIILAKSSLESGINHVDNPVQLRIRKALLAIRSNQRTGAIRELEKIIIDHPTYFFAQQVYGEVLIRDNSLRNGGKYFARGISGHKAFVSYIVRNNFEYDHREIMYFIEYASKENLLDEEYELFGQFVSGVFTSSINSVSYYDGVKDKIRALKEIQPNSEFAWRVELYLDLIWTNNRKLFFDQIAVIINKWSPLNIRLLDLELRSQLQPEVSLFLINEMMKDGLDDPLIFLYKYISATEANKYDIANVSASLCSDADPEFDLIYYYHGYYLMQGGHYEKALMEFQKGLEIAPYNKNYYSKISRCQYMANRG